MLRILKWILSCKRKRIDRALDSSDGREYLNLHRIFERIDSITVEKKMFLNPKVSLPSMAMEVGTNRTYISLAMRFKNISFREYINILRIKHMLEILWEVSSESGAGAEESGDKLDNEDLALTCGFSGKRAMNESLKKILGVRYSEIPKRDSKQIEKLSTFVAQKYNYGRREGNIFNEWGGEDNPS